jgi:hypothetical protein
MNRKFTSLLLVVAFYFLSFDLSAQNAGDYRSFTSGNWHLTTTWERYDGANWINPAPIAPSSTDGVITILNTHAVTIITSGITADELVIDAGGILNVNTGGTNQLNLVNGAGDDLVVNGTLNLGGNTINGVGTTTLVNGTMNWGTAATIVSTAITVSATGVVNLTGNTQKNILANFTNNGTFNWSTGLTAGGILLSNASVFTNNGTFNEQFLSNRGFILASTGSLVNNGSIIKTTTFPLNNNNVPITNNTTGTIGGIGDYVLSGTIVNNGIVAPGNGVGILAASPVIIQGQAATVNIEILDGSGPGTGHDRLDLTASTNLTGVTITIIEPTPLNVPFSTFTIMTTSGTFTGTPTLTNTNYSLTVTGTTVTVTKNAMFPLPLVWGEFNALARDNNQVKLSWSTLQETNVSHFVVEYSADGSNYTAISTIPAAGNTNSTTSYSFTHATPDLQRSNLYRIRQVDIDDRSSVSVTRLVRFSKGKVVTVIATPNPMRDNLQLSVQGQGAYIILNDLGGRAVRTMNINAGVQNLDVSNLPAGIYQLSVYEKGVLTDSQKLIKL